MAEARPGAGTGAGGFAGGGVEAEAVTRAFTRSDGSFRFARWGRPLAPVIFGTDAAGVRLFEDGIAGAAATAGLDVAGFDPELGANFLLFLTADWAELREVPHLAKLIPDLARLIRVLTAAGANQYRIFAFDGQGAIRICVTLIRMDEDLGRAAPATLALAQAAMGLLLWSDHAFLDRGPVAEAAGGAQLSPFVARLVRAAYDPVLPATASDPAFALRLLARMGPGR